jgi:hypothetical protein
LLCPLVSIERTLQVSIGEDRKSRSSDYFSVLASLSSYRCDLTFAYDVISILHVLFVFFNKKEKEKEEEGILGRICRTFSSWLIRYCMYLYLISQFCEH